MTNASTFRFRRSIPCSDGSGKKFSLTTPRRRGGSLARQARHESFLDSHDAKSVIGIGGERQGGRRQKSFAVRSASPGVLRRSKSKRTFRMGFWRFISVGYSVNEYTLDKTSKEEGDTRTVQRNGLRWKRVRSASPPTRPWATTARPGTGSIQFLFCGANPASEPGNLREVTVEPNSSASRSNRFTDRRG